MSDKPLDPPGAAPRRRRRSWPKRLLASILGLPGLFYYWGSRLQERTTDTFKLGVGRLQRGLFSVRTRLPVAATRRKRLPLVAELRWQLNELFFGHRLPYLLRGLAFAFVATIVTVGGMYGWQWYYRNRVSTEHERGVKALASADFATALESYAWLASHEAKLDDRFHLAESYAGLGQTDTARTLMQELAPANLIGYAPALAWLAQDAQSHATAEIASGEFEARLQRSIREQPKESSPREVLVRAYLDEGRAADAERWLGSEPELAPQAALTLAEYYAEHGDATRARAIASRVAARLRTDVTTRPNVSKRLEWARAVGLTGQHQEVANILERGIELHGPNPFALELIALHMQYADSLRRAGAPRDIYSPSYEQARRVIDLYPPPDANLLHYQIERALGSYGPAEAYLLKAIEKQPDLQLELARYRRFRKDVPGAQHAAEQARDVLRKQLAKDPANRDTRLALAESMTILQDFPAAVEILRSAPGDDQGASFGPQLADIYVAWWDTTTGRTMEHVELLAAALACQPNHHEAVRRLGTMINRSGEVGARARALLAGVAKSAATPKP